MSIKIRFNIFSWFRFFYMVQEYLGWNLFMIGNVTSISQFDFVGDGYGYNCNIGMHLEMCSILEVHDTEHSLSQSSCYDIVADLIMTSNNSAKSLSN